MNLYSEKCFQVYELPVFIFVLGAAIMMELLDGEVKDSDDISTTSSGSIILDERVTHIMTNGRSYKQLTRSHINRSNQRTG